MTELKQALIINKGLDLSEHLLSAYADELPPHPNDISSPSTNGSDEVSNDGVLAAPHTESSPRASDNEDLLKHGMVWMCLRHVQVLWASRTLAANRLPLQIELSLIGATALTHSVLRHGPQL